MFNLKKTYIRVIILPIIFLEIIQWIIVRKKPKPSVSNSHFWNLWAIYIRACNISKWHYLKKKKQPKTCLSFYRNLIAGIHVLLWIIQLLINFWPEREQVGTPLRCSVDDGQVCKVVNDNCLYLRLVYAEVVNTQLLRERSRRDQLK